MSSDKRTVTTDALETLGQIISENEKRDAIHLAVVPVRAPYMLRAGDDVNEKGYKERPYVGIVDPFLKEPVLAGQFFWLVIYPRQINSLRHVWTHPAFPDEVSNVTLPSKEEAERQLRAIADSWDGPDYETFLEIMTNGEAGEGYGNSWAIDGDYIFSYGQDSSGSIPPEVWPLAEIVLGRRINSRPQYFSCSC